MRRTHNRSRHGCKECKERHLRCDQARPNCLHCRTGNRLCSFLPDWKPQLPPSISLPSSFLPSPSRPPIFPLATTPAADPDGSSRQSYTLHHLSLLHHLESGLFFRSLNVGQRNDMCKTVIRRALQVPYLMDQLLALSAAHLISVIHPNDASRHQNEAAQLQTRGLTTLNRCTTDVASNNGLDMFLYSSFLGIHNMFDALQRRDLQQLLDAFITYVAVHRGVLAFARNSWQEIQPVVNLIVGDRTIFDRTIHAMNVTRTECAPLADLIDRSSSLTSAERETCRTMVESLQGAFDLRRVVSGACAKVHVVTACAARFPAAFLELLKQRVPEALVIFTYFAVLMYQSRQFWVFGESGQFLIRSITAYLGPSWVDCLTWPNEQISHAETALDLLE